MLPLVPLPASVERTSGPAFVISPATVIQVAPGDGPLLEVGRYLATFLGTSVGAAAPRVEASAARTSGAIRLEIGDVAREGPEAYELTVAPDGITARGRTAAGAFYAVQTLRQLLPFFVEHRGVRPMKSRPVEAPAVRINDAPRFAWRGAMLDVARHFLPAGDVKRFIDLMALHKLNRLHLHLSDDQGWRIEIASWPNLARHGGSTEVGGGPGGFYTREQFADLAAYASGRFITLVPEIDMPGHTNAALASYAELNCDGKARALYTGTEVGFSTLCVGREASTRFVRDVVREVAALTPGPYFHIGGDEVRTLAPEEYAGFIGDVQDVVQAHGKQMIGWDEVCAARLAGTSIVQHWRRDAATGAAAARGTRVILSPAERVYLDMKYDESTPVGLAWAGTIDVRRSYEWDPADVLGGVPEAQILGVEAPLWTETVAGIRDVELMAFPRLAAIAEVAWSGQARRTWSEFRMRLGAQAARWIALGINFHRAPEIPW